MFVSLVSLNSQLEVESIRTVESLSVVSEDFRIMDL